MAYTRQQHEVELALIQRLLDCFIDVAKQRNFAATDDLILQGKGRSVTIEVALQKGTSERVEYLTVGIKRGEAKNWFKIQSVKQNIKPTNKVCDSTRFTPTGGYIGGHIQFWHEQQGGEEMDQETFVNHAQELVQEVAGHWKIVSMTRRKLIYVNIAIDK